MSQGLGEAEQVQDPQRGLQFFLCNCFLLGHHLPGWGGTVTWGQEGLSKGGFCGPSTLLHSNVIYFLSDF